MKPTVALCAFLLLALSGCRVGPKYQPPCTEAPIEWKHQDEIPLECTQEQLPPLCNWWEVFQDSELNALESQAVDNNPNLSVAMARIEEAWALLDVDRANLYPQLTLSPTYINASALFKATTPPSTNPPGINIPTPSIQNPFRIHQILYILPMLLSYELDLWGKYRSQVDSDFRNAQAKYEAYRTALLSLTSDLASSYFNLRFLDTTIQLLQDTIESRRTTYKLAKTRYDNGLTNVADLTSASLELSNTESEYFDAVRQRGLQENVIATLIGMPASEFCIAPMPLEQTPPAVPAGIPSTILLRRPDIAEAERNMASQHAEIGVAYASFFPTFQLTTVFGYLSPTWKDFLTWKSRLFAFGGDMMQTIFDGGRKSGNYEMAIAKFNETYGTYRQQVLTAFREVEDALNNLEFQKKQSDSLQQSVDEATKLTALSMNRYKQGLTNYIEVVTNERSELNAKRSYVNLLSARYQSTVQLIKALGGGWDCKDEG